MVTDPAHDSSSATGNYSITLAPLTDLLRDDLDPGNCQQGPTIHRSHGSAGHAVVDVADDCFVLEMIGHSIIKWLRSELRCRKLIAGPLILANILR